MLILRPPCHFEMGFCSKGFSGCPGRVPYTLNQCKRHRISARVKAKIAVGRGNPNNEYVKAVLKANKPAEDFSQTVRKGSHCSKECCKVEVLTAERDQIIPGGFLPDKLQLPQPISSPGQWESKSPTLCKMDCCHSTLPVTEVHNQVANKFDILGFQ